MAQYVNRIIGQPTTVQIKPFEIVPSGDQFYVASGRCFSTFSYAWDSLIPVENLYQPISIPREEIKDYCFYIDFTILSNLQVSGAQVRATKVGKDAEDNEWVDYPDQYKIRPFDIKNDQGQVIQLIDGKRQDKCYLLLGKFSEEYPENEPYKISTITGGTSAEPKSYYLTQYASSDIFMFINQVSGVPITFPMPYFGAPYYKTPEEQPNN